MAFGALSLKGQALRYLSQREHSRAELARKLARKLAGSERDGEAASTNANQQIEAALDELAAHGLLSDERAAASVLHTQGRRFGERRLKQNLQIKGFAPELVAATLAQARAGEFERAHDVWQRKFGTPPQDAAERAKQARFLMARGFTTDVSMRVLRQCGATQQDEGA